MSYYEIYQRYKDNRWDALFGCVRKDEVERYAASDEQSERRLAALLSNAAESCLEDMARRAAELTLRNFGRTIQLYTPIYISNYCENECLYCGFNSNIDIERRRLAKEEIEKEADIIASSGLKHILVLTGESREMSPLSYIKDSVKILKKYFVSITIEIYPLTRDEYRELVTDGVDGLTIYQEVYDEKLYLKIHPAGPKRDYNFRLDAPERGASAGMRSVNIGTLLGLDDWRKEAFLTGLHAKYLQEKFPDVEVGVSVPRMRPHSGDFKAPFEVSDKNVVQIILALRLFLPRLGITLSTRESARFRENLIGLGVTRISAGSTTKVGGHTISVHSESGSAQFEISDRRSVDEIKVMLESKGYQPVFKDWMHIY
ncbi:MAG: 2-iminoacetate synthase ThiH [Candidatus Omnitrophota bacterium]|nr:2-iminoacetate synthase ThiH [Candidatus Omnitrophota bacterium]